MYIALITVDALALIGMMGLNLKKNIFNKWFWRIFLFIFSFVELWLIASMGFGKLWKNLYSLALILPAFYTIYLYGFSFNWKIGKINADLKRQKKGEKNDTDRSGT